MLRLAFVWFSLVAIAVTIATVTVTVVFGLAITVTVAIAIAVAIAVVLFDCSGGGRCAGHVWGGGAGRCSSTSGLRCTSGGTMATSGRYGVNISVRHMSRERAFTYADLNIWVVQGSCLVADVHLLPSGACCLRSACCLRCTC